MKTPSIHTLVALIAGALVFSGALVPSAAVADDREKVHELTGDWSGYYQGIGNPDTRAADLLIRSQRNRRFEGNFVLGPAPHIFPITGTTASCSNNLSPGEDVACQNNLFQGKSAAGKIKAQTTLTDFDGGAAILDGRLGVNLREAAQEEGSLLLLRNFIGNPDTTPPDVSGHYEGTATFGGEDVGFIVNWRPVRDERGAMTTGFEGTVMLQPREASGFPPFAGVVLGTVNADGEIVAIAQGETGRLVLTADFMDPTNAMPTQIIGRLRLARSDGSAHEGAFDAVMQAPPEPE